MACFNTISAPGNLVNVFGQCAYFCNPDITPANMNKALDSSDESVVLVVHFFIPEMDDIKKYRSELQDISLLDFQVWLEKRGGSVLVPITMTQRAYVGLAGQKGFSKA